MRWVSRIVLVVVLAVPFFWGLEGEEFHGDESHWVTSGQEAWWLVTSGRWMDPEWREQFYFYSQPQVGKVVIGAALAVSGRYGPTRIYDYDWQLLPEENRAVGRVPPLGAVMAGRVPGAIAGWAGCLLVWAMAGRVGMPSGAGPLAGVLLASQPLWLANARRVGLDELALVLGVGAALMVGEGVRRRRWVWWVAAGVAAGLAVGTKYVGVLAVLGGLAFVVGTQGPALCAPPPSARAFTRPSQARDDQGGAVDVRRVAVGGLVALLAGVLVFVGANPALYADPWEQVRVSVGFLTYQAEGMRATIPEFGSPLWVGVEIVDRVFWPLGFPHVVEGSMREPLVPGTYGTPIIALGAVLGLTFLRRVRGGGVAVWALVVYVALVLSLPTWWERWHLPLVLPLTLLAGAGLCALPRGRWWLSPALALAGAQYVGALALLPSYLGKGFGQLVMQPLGAVAHVAALAYALVTLVSLALHRRAYAGPARQPLPRRAA